MDATEARARARYEAETDPVQREAYALAKRAGFDWYNTESGARRMAEHAAEEVIALKSELAARPPLFFHTYANGKLVSLEDDATFGALVEDIRAKRIAAGLDPDTGSPDQPASRKKCSPATHY